MREVGTFDDERTARRFADVLCSADIDASVSEGRSGKFGVWVVDEHDVEASRTARAAFEADPDAPQYRAAEGCIERKQRTREALEKESRHEVVDMRKRFSAAPAGPTRVTAVLIGLSVAITVAVQFGKAPGLLSALLIGEQGEPLFAAVLRGQAWRLVTPIFVHFGFLHILFNMWWLGDLGAAIERRLGSTRLLGIVAVTAVFSNAFQYVLGQSPVFGGMSGVVYALLGYVWVRGRRDPGFGLALTQQTIVILLVWLGLGFTNVLGNMANYAHLGGLMAGAALGFAAAVRRR